LNASMQCIVRLVTQQKLSLKIYVASIDPRGLSTRLQMFKDSFVIGVPDKNKPLRHA